MDPVVLMMRHTKENLSEGIFTKMPSLKSFYLFTEYLA
jgi:hypothetical protein